MCFNMYLLPIFGDDWQLGFWWKKMQIGFENVCQNKQIPSMLLCSASCSMTFRNDPFAWGVAKAQNSRCYLTTVLKSCLNCLRNLWIRPNNNIRKEGGGGSTHRYIWGWMYSWFPLPLLFHSGLKCLNLSTKKLWNLFSS